jgi:cysteine-rich repeat protein
MPLLRRYWRKKRTTAGFLKNRSRKADKNLRNHRKRREKMRKIIAILAVSFAMTALNVSPARADLPPEIWHCASQENCFALLTSDDIVITREGEEKGRITGMGTGNGFISASGGVIIVTRIGDNNVYIHDLATGSQCSIDAGEQCYPGVVLEVGGTYYAHVVCPVTEFMWRIPLTCFSKSEIPTNGLGPREVTKSQDRVFVAHNDAGTIGQMIPPSPGILGYSTGFNTLDSIVYLEGTNSIYLNNETGIYEKAVPLQHGNATLLQSLPWEIGHLSGAGNYLAAAGTIWDGYIIDVNNPSNYITVSLEEPRTTAVSTANQTRVCFIETGTPGGVRIRVFDQTGQETEFSPIMTGGYDIDYIEPALPPVCINGLVEPGEVCDGSDLQGQDCLTQGFDDGILECAGDCLGFNTDQCFYVCGNDSASPTEACDGQDLKNENCLSMGFVGGTLTCDASCMFDTGQCHMCGNSIADSGETCDGTDTPGMICETLGLGYTGGELSCNSACDDYDDSGCWTCGDGTVNANEMCDGANLNGMDCQTLGLGSGTLECFANCEYNVSQCDSAPAEYCGNGVVDPGEECDDGNRSNTDDPAPGDTLRCSENCMLIPATCGVGGIDAGEECDGNDLGGQTCQSLGYQSGVLYCGTDCKLRTEDCGFESGSQTISLEMNAEPESGEFDTSLQGEYEALKSTLTPSCISQDVGGDLVVTTEPGSYCVVRATSMSKGVEKRVLDVLFMPENALDEELPILRIYPDGGIAQNHGGHLTAYQGLDVTTVLVQERVYQVSQASLASIGVKFVRINPETEVTGNWVGFKGELDLFSYCEDPSSGTCGYIPGEREKWNYINLNEFFETLVDTRENPKSKSGCNASKTSNTTPGMMLLLILAMLYVIRRRNS